MRLLFAALILTLLSQSAWAEPRQLDQKSMKGHQTRTICVDGYKFVIAARRDAGEPLSIVQFYEEKDDVACQRSASPTDHFLLFFCCLMILST
jgi:hypothetical protein